ncbi:MAG: GNAT family N-acetyltransferase [Bacteroidia bacterium]
MKIIIETERLFLREMTEVDAENAYLLNSEFDVIKYTGDEAFSSVEEARTFLRSYPDYKLHGYGRWAVIRKEDSRFLGWCGIKYSPHINEHDIGFRFMKAYWNKGYASEAALACLNYGIKSLNLKTIVGNVRVENKASIQVLKKIGLSYVGEFIEQNTLHYKFKIDNF